jgi:predicted RNA binding protein YcfA (HicA-like mRNA interferase family)
MKYSEVERKLKAAGCRLESHGANHDWWYSPITGRRFQLPRHRSEEAKPKTLKNISQQSGVDL